MITVYRVEACTDCVMLIANGTDGHCVECSGDVVCEATMARIKRIDSSLSYAVGNSIEAHFSHSPCGVCGTILSGDRLEVSVWEEK